MTTVRSIEQVIGAKPVMEGAGVKLNRVFAHLPNNILDPFLLLDHFGSENPADYLAGFPWHPHRGIETVTYMLSGQVEHQDNLGNHGTITAGDIQWMTAGSGIIHQEMPKAGQQHPEGFQLWVNLPAREKMIAPRYRGFTAEQIPSIEVGAATVKIICGQVDQFTGPVTDLLVKTTYLDIALPAHERWHSPITFNDSAFVYIYRGAATVSPNSKQLVTPKHLVHFTAGDAIEIQTADEPCRFLLIAGQPLGEPIAWGGPIVMTTQEELDQAFVDYQNGTFIKT